MKCVCVCVCCGGGGLFACNFYEKFHRKGYTTLGKFRVLVCVVCVVCGVCGVWCV